MACSYCQTLFIQCDVLDCSAGTVIRLESDNQGSEVQFLAEADDFPVVQSILPFTDSHAVSYPITSGCKHLCLVQWLIMYEAVCPLPHMH
jgi:hypothetical protein